MRAARALRAYRVIKGVHHHKFSRFDSDLSFLESIGLWIVAGRWRERRGRLAEEAAEEAEKAPVASKAPKWKASLAE